MLYVIEHINYHPRVQVGNVFVVSICVSVCLFGQTFFEMMLPTNFMVIHLELYLDTHLDQGY